MFWRLAIAALTALSLTLPVADARTQENESAPAEDVLLSADEVSYDDALGTATASGSVEISQGERVLLADTVTYNQAEDLITATGNVTLLEPGGEVVFADYVELKDQMKDGVIRKLKVLLTDKSRFAANGARRTGGNRTDMSKAVYSPCQLCPDHPDRPLLWQLKAARIVHDQEAQDIAYHDAWLEVFGIPIAYTPYFEHPDPTVDRRSGFLAPSYGTSTNLGVELTTPYYWNIAPDRDVTFSPKFTSKEGVVLATEYRELAADGQFAFDGSATYVDKRDDDGIETGGKEFRGHIFGDGTFELDPVWRWGFELERASDDTYLKRYRIDSKDTLTTRPFVEGFNDRTYVGGNAYFFQGLKAEDEQDTIPIVLPLVDFNYVGEQILLGGHPTLDANLMILQREDGTDSRRLSLEGGWHLPYVASSGEVWQLSATLRGDLYHVNNVETSRQLGGPTSNGVTGRVRPEVLLGWRYPLINRAGGMHILFEPVVQAIASPFGGNPDDIPNEDSQDFEFDHTNLFSTNRFTGLDRVESGPRVNYGIRMGVYGSGGGRTTAVFGQSARLKEDDTFSQQSGLEKHLSDYVGRLTISPVELFDLDYRFRLASESFEVRRNEVNIAAGPKYLRFSVGYALLEELVSAGDTTAFANREEVVAAAAADLIGFWRVDATMRRDLTGDGQTINYGGALTYEDECFLFSTRFTRDFTRDRDAAPESNILFTLRLKHLG